MDLILIRNEKRADGIFGTLREINKIPFFFTLEHSYKNGDEWEPKIPIGEYVCVRGVHQLHSIANLVTYEVTNVPGHTGILIHPGNFDNDSEGCILIGKSIFRKSDGTKMLLNSKEAFEEFMELQADCPSFKLTVKE